MSKANQCISVLAILGSCVQALVTRAVTAIADPRSNHLVTHAFILA